MLCRKDILKLRPLNPEHHLTPTLSPFHGGEGDGRLRGKIKRLAKFDLSYEAQTTLNPNNQ